MEASVEYRPRLKESKSTSPRSALRRRAARPGSPGVKAIPVAYRIRGCDSLRVRLRAARGMNGRSGSSAGEAQLAAARPSVLPGHPGAGLGAADRARPAAGRAEAGLREWHLA